MSYRIYIDDNLMYSPVAVQRYYAITDGSISYELNKAPTLEFTIPPNHPLYNNYVKMKSIVTVYADKDLIFRGRILRTTRDFFKCKTFTCEGDLAFLNDSVIAPYEYTGTVTNYFTQELNNHNSQVDTFKQFEKGTVDIIDSNNNITRANEDYVYTFEELTNKLVSELGGYLSVTHETTEDPITGDDIDHNYLNFTEESGGVNSQVLSFGRNILELEQYISGEDLCTVMIPLGAKDESTGVRLTVSSVNSGSIYIEDADAVSLYGRIVKTVIWDDVTVASNLLTKGTAELSNAIKEALTISINALDLNVIDVDETALKLGEYNRVYSPPHDIDDYYQLSKMSINILDPKQSTYTFGYAGSMSLTDAITKSVASNKKTMIVEE